MSVFRSTVFVIALVAVAQPVAAWDGVELVQADGRFGSLWHQYGSPIPGWCTWEHDESTGPIFSVTQDDGTYMDQAGCIWPSFMHCDSDSLSYMGSWPLIESEYTWGVRIETWISCSVNITAETKLSASRSVAGNLDTDNHSVTIDFPDGTTVPVLQEGIGPDQNQLVLLPGTYVVNITVFAYQESPDEEVIDPYDGHILLKWEDPSAVAVEPMSWSSLKATYR